MDWTCGTGGSVEWLRASLADIAKAWTTYVDWVCRWWQVAPEPVQEVHGTGLEMISHLEPGYSCGIVAETSSRWTAWLSELPFSWELVPLVPCSTVRIESAHTADGLPGTGLRIVRQPLVTGPDIVVALRDVGVTKDERSWHFNEYGEPAHFEEVDRYLLRNRRERLTADMLARYAVALDIPLGEDEVLTGKGLYLRDPPWSWDGCSDSAAAAREFEDMKRERW